MADTASDIRVEFDRENGSIGHKFRFAYHNGPIFAGTNYRVLSTEWPDIVSTASASYSAFAAHMDAEYSPWWDNLPGVAERLSCCNAVREILGLSTLT